MTLVKDDPRYVEITCPRCGYAFKHLPTDEVNYAAWAYCENAACFSLLHIHRDKEGVLQVARV